MRAADLVSTNHGTIITILPITPRGRVWMAAHVPDCRPSTYAVDCDHRCGVDILTAAIGAGLTLRDTSTGRTATAQGGR